MYLEKLELKNFRNYHQLGVNFSPKLNIFFGHNAQGKTNLLEAVSLLGLGKSFRTKKEDELIQWGKETCFLHGNFQTGEYEIKIELGIGNREKRLKLDGQIIKNNELFGKIPIVTFAPDDLQLIKGGPQLRRDFIDLYLALIEPKYRFIYYNYYKVLQQRNRLLKEGVRDLNELEVWNEQLIEKGTKVIKYRLYLINNVKSFIVEAQHNISGTLEKLNIDYLGFKGVNLSFDFEEESIKELFKNELKNVCRYEIERKITLIGPQRDDIKLSLDQGVDLRNFGSQGQQRTAALALKIGLIEKIKESRGCYPILLLDDVMSEFDDQRKKQLLKVLISSAQTFLTSTSFRDFPVEDEEAYFFEVKQGEVYFGR